MAVDPAFGQLAQLVSAKTKQMAELVAEIGRQSSILKQTDTDELRRKYDMFLNGVKDISIQELLIRTGCDISRISSEADAIVAASKSEKKKLLEDLRAVVKARNDLQSSLIRSADFFDSEALRIRAVADPASAAPSSIDGVYGGSNKPVESSKGEGSDVKEVMITRIPTSGVIDVDNAVRMWNLKFPQGEPPNKIHETNGSDERSKTYQYRGTQSQEKDFKVRDLPSQDASPEKTQTPTPLEATEPITTPSDSSDETSIFSRCKAVVKSTAWENICPFYLSHKKCSVPGCALKYPGSGDSLPSKRICYTYQKSRASLQSLPSCTHGGEPDALSMHRQKFTHVGEEGFEVQWALLQLQKAHMHGMWGVQESQYISSNQVNTEEKDALPKGPVDTTLLCALSIDGQNPASVTKDSSFEQETSCSVEVLGEEKEVAKSTDVDAPAVKPYRPPHMRTLEQKPMEHVPEVLALLPQGKVSQSENISTDPVTGITPEPSLTNNNTSNEIASPPQMEVPPSEDVSTDLSSQIEVPQSEDVSVDVTPPGPQAKVYKHPHLRTPELKNIEKVGITTEEVMVSSTQVNATQPEADLVDAADIPRPSILGPKKVQGNTEEMNTKPNYSMSPPHQSVFAGIARAGEKKKTMPDVAPEVEEAEVLILKLVNNTLQPSTVAANAVSTGGPGSQETDNTDGKKIEFVRKKPTLLQEFGHDHAWDMVLYMSGTALWEELTATMHSPQSKEASVAHRRTAINPEQISSKPIHLVGNLQKQYQSDRREAEKKLIGRIGWWEKEAQAEMLIVRGWNVIRHDSFDDILEKLVLYRQVILLECRSFNMINFVLSETPQNLMRIAKKKNVSFTFQLEQFDEIPFSNLRQIEGVAFISFYFHNCEILRDLGTVTVKGLQEEEKNQVMKNPGTSLHPTFSTFLYTKIPKCFNSSFAETILNDGIRIRLPFDVPLPNTMTVQLERTRGPMIGRKQGKLKFTGNYLGAAALTNIMPDFQTLMKGLNLWHDLLRDLLRVRKPQENEKAFWELYLCATCRYLMPASAFSATALAQFRTSESGIDDGRVEGCHQCALNAHLQDPNTCPQYSTYHYDRQVEQKNCKEQSRPFVPETRKNGWAKAAK